PQVIELTMAEVRRVLGVELPQEECARLLRSLEFQVEPMGKNALRATVPPQRLDIQEGPADLIEELARLYGYDRLPATLLAEQLPEQAANVELAFEEQVRDLLVAVGLQEAITYALTTQEKEAPLKSGGLRVESREPEAVGSGLSTLSSPLLAGEYVRLLNPIS